MCVCVRVCVYLRAGVLVCVTTWTADRVSGIVFENAAGGVQCVVDAPLCACACACVVYVDVGECV